MKPEMETKYRKMKRIALRSALFAEYGSVMMASKELAISYHLLSKLICGWRDPTVEQRAKLVKVFGAKQVKEFFSDASEEQAA